MNSVFVNQIWQTLKHQPISFRSKLVNKFYILNRPSRYLFTNEPFCKLFVNNMSSNSGEKCMKKEAAENSQKAFNKVNEGQHSICLLEDVLSLQNKKITNWAIENKVKSLCCHYKTLQKDNKEIFLKELATKYAINHSALSNIIHQTERLEVDSEKLLKIEEKLKILMVPQYSWLFKNIGRLENGVKFLVDLRTDIMNLLPELDAKKPEYIAIQQLNTAIRELLTVWFSVGFLNLEKITWNSPCSILEKISMYDAVHPIKDWAELKHRVGPYRRCFVYTHNSMPGEPLVVLHVALTKEIISSLKGITTAEGSESQVNESQPLGNEDPNLIKALIFYSISSTQKGLQGIELGNYLIKDAVNYLITEYPQATMFSTLSPIPTFKIWLIERIKLAEKGEQIFPTGLWNEVLQYLSSNKKEPDWAHLREVILSNSWYHNPELVCLLKHPLMVCCSRYLYVEKRRGYAYDSVANFHLRNGAVMWRLNWLADVSPRGLTNSCGMMVNYRYYLKQAEDNSFNYVQNQKINVCDQIVALSTSLTAKL